METVLPIITEEATLQPFLATTPEEWKAEVSPLSKYSGCRLETLPSSALLKQEEPAAGSYCQPSRLAERLMGKEPA